MQMSQAPEGLSGHRHAQDSNTPVHGIKSCKLCVYILIIDRQEKQEKNNPHRESETVTATQKPSVSKFHILILIASSRIYIRLTYQPTTLLRTIIQRNCASACFAFPRLPCYCCLTSLPSFFVCAFFCVKIRSAPDSLGLLSKKYVGC